MLNLLSSIVYTTCLYADPPGGTSADGQVQKDIALMLSAGSPIVRRLVQDQGKQPAMLYVNQTVRKVLSRQQKRTVTRSRQYDQELS
ncbi:hypothetical protein VB741_14805 [Leptothoe sp. PORK10 BA2]|nr:hypothetical protein [Leptothoe sp. PORK10 BA2]